MYVSQFLVAEDFGERFVIGGNQEVLASWDEEPTAFECLGDS